MIRYSNLTKLLARSRYVLDHRKPRVTQQKHIPPKYVYRVRYLENANPGIDMGFPDHEHTNPFLDLAGSKHENFRYRYVGQWWEGYSVTKMFLFVAPLLIGLVCAIQIEKRIQRNEPSFATPQNGTSSRYELIHSKLIIIIIPYHHFLNFYIHLSINYFLQSRSYSLYKINYYSKQNNKIIGRNPMQRERPKSASSTYSTYIPNKPKMQTRYKQRNGSRSVLGQSVIINESVPQQKLQIKTKDNTKQVRGEKEKKQKQRSNSVIIQSTSKVYEDLNNPNDFKKTACMLTNQLYKSHHSQQCVCDLCNCGRHLCKFHSPAQSLPKRTSYDRDYNRKKSFIPNKVFIASEYPKFQGPNLQPNSTYFKDFPGKNNDDLSRPKPQNNLKFDGPSPNLSSYKADYLGHKGPNQYVKPTDNHRRDDFPLRGRTTYGSTFLGAAPKKDEYQKIQNNLKCGSGWFGDSTYNNFFNKPNPESYAVPVKKKQKLEINPDYKRQFETSYRNNFKKPEGGPCPAKIQLQTRRKGQFKDSKIKFLENSDFKAMSPEFRSHSTSKCY